MRLFLMPKFECKKYHCKCKAECCGIVPIPRTLWQKKQHAIQRHPKEVMSGIATNKITGQRENIVIPLTEDNYCPFLKKDLSCAIYDERPEVCRKFGDESHPMLCCPMQDKDGNPKTDLPSVGTDALSSQSMG